MPRLLARDPRLRKRDGSNTMRTSIYLPRSWVKTFEQWVEEGRIDSRNQVIEEALRARYGDQLPPADS